MLQQATAQAITFADVSATAGVVTGSGGHGAAVHDYNGDGWDDVFIAVTQGTSALFRNNRDGTFTDVSVQARVTVIGTYDVALWGDLDNDGYADLFVGQGASGQSKVFRNNGDGTFADVSAGSGLDLSANIATAAFGDYDDDGTLDLFAAVDQGLDRLYRNTGRQDSIRFENVSNRANINGMAGSVPMQTTWADYDHDGDLDLFCVHDGRVPSRLYKNGGFLPLSNIAASARIDTYPSDTVCCNMGIAWGDFDGDGWEDVYVTRIGQGGLFHNNGDGTFTDIAAERGAVRNGMSWGVVFADFDNDGDQDLFIVSTSGYDGTPTLLYENEDGLFSEVGARAGASFLLEAQGLAAGDFNNDGRPDLVIPTHTGNHKLLLNTTEAAGHWLALRLRGEQHNRMAVGVRAEVVAGGRVHQRVVSGGDSFASQSSSTLHIGLGAATRVDTLRIYWGGGAVQEQVDLDADQAYTLIESMVSTGRATEAAAPSAFRLEPNYPNPFNPVTTIRYALAEAGPIRLEVFDVLGRRVAVLAEGVQMPGIHAVVFNAEALPGGVYLYRLQAGGRIETRRMLLMR